MQCKLCGWWRTRGACQWCPRPHREQPRATNQPLQSAPITKTLLQDRWNQAKESANNPAHTKAEHMCSHCHTRHLRKQEHCRSCKSSLVAAYTVLPQTWPPLGAPAAVVQLYEPAALPGLMTREEPKTTSAPMDEDEPMGALATLTTPQLKAEIAKLEKFLLDLDASDGFATLREHTEASLTQCRNLLASKRMPGQQLDQSLAKLKACSQAKELAAKHVEALRLDLHNAELALEQAEQAETVAQKEVQRIRAQVSDQEGPGSHPGRPHGSHSSAAPSRHEPHQTTSPGTLHGPMCTYAPKPRTTTTARSCSPGGSDAARPDHRTSSPSSSEGRRGRQTSGLRAHSAEAKPQSNPAEPARTQPAPKTGYCPRATLQWLGLAYWVTAATGLRACPEVGGPRRPVRAPKRVSLLFFVCLLCVSTSAQASWTPPPPGDAAHERHQGICAMSAPAWAYQHVGYCTQQHAGTCIGMAETPRGLLLPKSLSDLGHARASKRLPLTIPSPVLQFLFWLIWAGFADSGASWTLFGVFLLPTSLSRPVLVSPCTLRSLLSPLVCVTATERGKTRKAPRFPRLLHLLRGQRIGEAAQPGPTATSSSLTTTATTGSSVPDPDAGPPPPEACRPMAIHEVQINIKMATGRPATLKCHWLPKFDSWKWSTTKYQHQGRGQPSQILREWAARYKGEITPDGHREIESVLALHPDLPVGPPDSDPPAPAPSPADGARSSAPPTAMDLPDPSRLTRDSRAATSGQRRPSPLSVTFPRPVTLSSTRSVTTPSEYCTTLPSAQNTDGCFFP